MRNPTHHCALGVDHHAGTLRKIARLIGLEFIEVGSTLDEFATDFVYRCDGDCHWRA